MATHALPHVSRIRPPFRPILEVAADYCRLPVADGFNWGEAFADVEDSESYLVAFRSKHATDADEARLTRLDEQASAAASRHPGFLYYVIGTPLPDGGCHSFCLWESAIDARAAADDPAHRLAMDEGLPEFEYYWLERFRLRKEGGVLAYHDLPSSCGARWRPVVPRMIHPDGERPTMPRAPRPEDETRGRPLRDTESACSPPLRLPATPR